MTEPTRRTGGKMSEKNKLIVYRQNEKLDKVADAAESRSEEYPTKVFPAGTPEEEISSWAESQELEALDWILADKTFKRSYGRESEELDLYSLDRLYQHAQRKAMESIRYCAGLEESDIPPIITRLGGTESRSTFMENFGKEDLQEIFQSFTEQPEKIYIMYSRITDHLFEDLKEEVAEGSGYSDEALREEVANRFGGWLEEAGYETEVVGSEVNLPDLEKGSWLLMDGHAASMDCPQFEREPYREDSKLVMMLDDLYRNALELRLWKGEDDVLDPVSVAREDFEKDFKAVVYKALDNMPDEDYSF